MSIKRIIANNKILKNFSVLTFSNAITQFLLIFTSIKIARSLDPVLFGTYNLLQLHVSIIAVLASMGLRNIVIRTIARDKTIVKKVFYISFVIRSIGIVTSVVLFCVYFFFFQPYDNILFVLVIICLLFSVFLDLLESVAFGLEKMEFSGIINLSGTLVWLITILLIPKRYLSLHLIFGLFVLFGLFRTSVYFLLLYKKSLIKGFDQARTTKLAIFEFSKECFPYYYLGLLTLLSNQIPLLFLEYRSGVEQIGFFNIASKILMPINLVLTTALAAVFPNLSRLFISNYPGFIKNIKLIFILISLFSISGAFGVTFFRQEVIHLLYGEKYNSSSLVLGYQCWYMAIYSGVCLIGTILGAINKQKELSYLSVVCTIIQVPILWYGAKYGAQYLSAAFLFATVIIFAIHIIIIHQYLKDNISILFYVKILALYIVGYTISLVIPLDLSLPNKIVIFLLITAISLYFVFRKYRNNLTILFKHQ